MLHWFSTLRLLPLVLLAAGCGDDDTASSARVSDAGTTGDGAPREDANAAHDAGNGAVDVPPTVVSSAPANAATDVSPNGEITVLFSEAMATLTLTSGATFTLSQGSTAVPGTVAAVENIAIFTPTSALALDTTYTAAITTAAQDLGGVAMMAPYTWTFKTTATAPLGPAPVLLGTAGNYVVLAKAEITNVPTSKITGDVAISPAAASYITGFGLTKVGTYWTSPQVVGRLFAADNDPPTPDHLTTAVSNMETAYTNAAGRPTPNFLNNGSGNIGGATLKPGLYKWTSTVTVPNDVVISGAANDVWIFQITGDLKMSASTAMTLSGGARAENIFWQVAGLVDLGTAAHAEGVMLSKTAIKLGTGASINGRLLAQTAVNVAGTTITAPAP